MAPEYRRLNENSRAYQKIREDFELDWYHTERSAIVQAIYHVDEYGLDHSYRGRRFNAYRRRWGGRYKTRYHGTRRACLVGERGSRLRPCRNPDCSMCGILNHSFKIPRTNWGCMFGNGVYTTTISSKADLFSENYDIHSELYAVFLCRIVSNRLQYLRRPDNYRTHPDRGYDSVEAVLTRDGGTVNYPETIVYREDAIVPVGVILYNRREQSP